MLSLRRSKWIGREGRGDEEGCEVDGVGMKKGEANEMFRTVFGAVEGE